MIHFNKEHDAWVATYDTVADMVRACDNASEQNAENPDAKRRTADERASSFRTDHAWYGDSSFENVVAMVTTTGWRSGLDKARKNLEITNGYVPRVAAIKPILTWTDHGDDIEIDKVYSGELETAWRGKKKKKIASGAKLITVAIQFDALAYRSAEDFFWRGAVAAVVADALESAGYRVKILAYQHDRKSFGEKNYCSTIGLKDHREPLELEKLIAVTGHVGAFRWLGLGAMNEVPDRVNRHYGITVDGPLPVDKLQITETALSIYGCYDQSTAKRLIEKLLAEAEQ